MRGRSWSQTQCSQSAGDSMHSHGPGGGLPPPSTRPTATHMHIIKPAVGGHYFPPGPQLPSQPSGITALRPVPSYTAWWQRYISVRNLPRVFTPWCPAETRTRDLLITSPTLYRNTTMPTSFILHVSNFSLMSWCRLKWPVVTFRAPIKYLNIVSLGKLFTHCHKAV